MNKAAVSSFVSAASTVQARLEQIFTDSNVGTDKVTLWTDQILANSYGAPPEVGIIVDDPKKSK